MITPEVRSEVLNRAHGHCEECGSAPSRQAGPGSLAVHHLEYRPLDAPENLRVLCGRCHRLAHPRGKESGRPIGSGSMTIRLSDDARRILSQMSARLGVSRTAVMEMAIRLYGDQQGVKAGGEYHRAPQ